MSENRYAKPNELTVGLDLGVVKVEGVWIPTEPERKASWDLYIELITRISVMELPDESGILREGLTSLYTLFSKTREILHSYGPDVLRVSDEDNMSFGYLAIVVLNYVLRPFLTKWHPKLLDWEDLRQDNVSRVAHERKWEHNAQLRQELNNIRVLLIEYAILLTKVADVPSLIFDPNVPTSNEFPRTTLKNEELPYFGSTDDQTK